MSTYYRYDGNSRINPGPVVAGAQIAVLTQPADTTTQPGSPLATLYSAGTSNSASVSTASYSGGLIIFVFSTTPSDDVVPGAFISVSGVSPSGYNGVWEVISVSGDDVTVAIPYTQTASNPGTYSSGGTIATSALPNPLQSDGNGNWFFYAAVTLYTIQIYGGAIPISQLVFPDQAIGTPGSGTVTSVGLTGDGVIFNTTVTNSPITTSGDLIPVLLTETANTVLAGPPSSIPATPTFRALVTADLPSGTGTVTSAALAVTVPGWLSVSVTGSPVTTSGTLTAAITATNEDANTVLAGPTSGGSGAPSFRGLVAADLASAVAGSDTQVQVNSGGVFYADSGFTYDHTTGIVAIAGSLTIGTPLAVIQGGTGTTTPALVAGSNVTITGTWPNQTITSVGTSVVNSVNLTTQVANISATTLYSVGAGASGLYRISSYIVVSQAASVSSTLPDSEIIYVDKDSGATITVPITSSLTGNTLSTFSQSELIINAAASSVIQYAVGQNTAYASSGSTPMQFAYRSRVEFLT